MKKGIARRVTDLLRSVARFFRRVPGARPTAPGASAAAYVNRIVADSMLFNEIPSPTEREGRRADFIVDRLLEFGYPEPSADDAGNVTVCIPAARPTEDYLLLFAETRSEDYSPTGSLARLDAGRVHGRGIAQNSIGVGTLLVLAEYLAAHTLPLALNLRLLFTSFNPEHQDANTMGELLDSWSGRPRFAIHVRALELGRIEERPMGTYKLLVTVRTPEREVAGTGHSPSAITTLADIAHRLGSIRWDSDNSTFLNIARIEAGSGFGWYASTGVLEIEVFSGDRNALEITRKAVTATIDSISTESGAQADVAVKAFFPAANAAIGADLAKLLRGVHSQLRIKSKTVSIPGHTAFFNALGIPAVSVGITTGRRSLDAEYVDIKPIETGFRQLLAFLQVSGGVGAESTA